jgi:5'-methylthioadenosine phosphorylase
MAVDQTAEIGVFGGSGFYSFLEDVERVAIETPYGAPSDQVAVGSIGGRKVAFLPRHGSAHQFPPHQVNYRANVDAMKQLGVTRIIGPCASGSLQVDVKPGDFVLCDQFVDRTRGRIDSFYDGPVSTHVSAAEPYCSEMRSVAGRVGKDMGLDLHETGTVVVVQGPRFSTKAESRWFSAQGWQVINMTQYPESFLAREVEICYLNISLITDWDVGLEDHPAIEPVTLDEVVRTFNENNAKLRDYLFKLIPELPAARDCVCSKALEGARFTV